MTITEFISTGCGLDSFNVVYKLTNLSNGIVQLDNNYNIVNSYYDYRTANIRIHELTGTYGNLQFNTNQKRTKLRGTRKAGFIWMQYSYYKQLISSNESIGYT